MTFTYDMDLLLRAYYEWKRSGFAKWPDPHEIANRNIAFSNDLMTIDRIVCAFEARVKRQSP